MSNIVIYNEPNLKNFNVYKKIFYVLFIKYQIYCQYQQRTRKKVSKEKEKMAYEEKNCFDHNGSIVWTFSYRMRF